LKQSGTENAQTNDVSRRWWRACPKLKFIFQNFALNNQGFILGLPVVNELKISREKLLLEAVRQKNQDILHNRMAGRVGYRLNIEMPEPGEINIIGLPDHGPGRVGAAQKAK